MVESRICNKAEHHHPTNITQQTASKSINFFHVRLKSISIALIDPSIKQEIMELTLGDIDYRQSSNESKTRYSLTMESLQLDNHLTKASASVILAQKRVRFMQPVLRLHALYNKTTSHMFLDCYETVEVVIQELDLKLEQQTIIVTWVFIEDLLQQVGMSFTEKSRPDVCSLTNYGFINPNSQGGKAGPLSQEKRASKIQVKSIENDNNSRGMFNDRKLYIDLLAICLIKINISFITTSDIVLSTFSDNINTEDVRKSFSSNNNRFLIILK